MIGLATLAALDDRKRKGGRRENGGGRVGEDRALALGGGEAEEEGSTVGLVQAACLVEGGENR
jgi:hypothetical protein